MSKYFYLSFADDNGFLGATIVQADSIKEAFFVTISLDINPGGEIKGAEIPEPVNEDEERFKAALLNRLVGLEELELLTDMAKWIE